MDNPYINGIFNVGSGECHSFEELAIAVFNSSNIETRIEYIDMPQNLTKTYQYYTKADISLLRSVGYKKDMTNLSSGIQDYVVNYLAQDYKVY